jgi:hypothetical protein
LNYTGNRREVTFWKVFFKTLAKIENIEMRSEKLRAFESVIQQLLDQIIGQMRAEDQEFENFNYNSEQDEVFDELLLYVHLNLTLCSKRDEWGRVFEKIGKACPVSDIMAFLNQRLSEAVAKA